MKCEFIIVTKGPFGSLSYTGDGITITPALTDKVVDRVGAGDALFAMTSPLVAAKFDRELIPFIGNVAGAIQVQTVGNKKPIEFEDMARFINRLLK